MFTFVLGYQDKLQYRHQHIRLINNIPKYSVLGQNCHAMLHGCQKSRCTVVTGQKLLGGL